MERPATPRAPRLWVLVFFALVAGAVGSAAIQWRALQQIAGVGPAEQYPTLEVRRETAIEESARIAAVERTQTSIVRVLEARTDGASTERAPSIGIAVALTDDGLFLAALRSSAPQGAWMLETLDGYAIPTTRAGRDPWSGVMLLRADLRGLPVGAVTPAVLSDAALRPGQHLVGVTDDTIVAVHAALVASNGRGDLPTGALIDAAAWDPAPQQPTIYIDLTGNIVGIAPDASTSIRAASLDALVRTYQLRAAVARPTIGIAATTLLPGTRLDDAIPPYAARVTDITPDSPAARTTLVVGDVITAVNGRTLTSAYTLLDACTRVLPERALTFTVLRAGVTSTVELTTGILEADRT